MNETRWKKNCGILLLIVGIIMFVPTLLGDHQLMSLMRQNELVMGLYFVIGFAAVWVGWNWIQGQSASR